MTTTRLSYFNNQELPAWVVNDWKDDTGTQWDMSSGWTFTVTLARTTAPATALAIKSTGITASATAVTVAWSTTDWSGLEAAVNGTDYVVILQAVRTSDSYSVAYRPASPPTLKLKAAPGTSAVSPSSYPITVTAASVTLADTSDYLAATNVEAGIAEVIQTWKHTGTRAFLRNLGQSLRPTAVCVMGDSTGNETSEWPYTMTSWLGSLYPAFTTHYRLWDDTAQGWGLPTTVTTGTGGEAYMALDGTGSRLWRAADSATNSITGDISVRAKFTPTGSWASGVAQCVASKFGSAGQRSWRFEITAAGNLFMEISPDGTTQLQKTSTAAVSFASATTGYIRVDVDVDNGASGWNVLFYTSPDGTTWTQLGTTVTTATVTSIFDSTATLDIGGRTGNGLNGNLYAVDVYNGIAASSPLAASWRAGEMYVVAPSANSATGTDCCGNVYTGSATAATTGVTGAPVLAVYNASVTGQDLTYFTNVTRFAKVFAGRIKLAILNIGHNHAGLYYDGDSYRAPYLAWIAQMVAVQPDVAVIITAQNPEISPKTATEILTHRDRARELVAVAAVGNHGLVDVYRAFTDTGDVATYMDADGIHPNTAGKALWLSTLQRFMLRA